MSSSVSNPTHTCPVCGYAQLDEPALDLLGEPTYSICPSCGTQFGYDDATRSHDELRADWLAGGGAWWSEVKHAPADWNATTQLASAGLASQTEAPKP